MDRDLIYNINLKFIYYSNFKSKDNLVNVRLCCSNWSAALCVAIITLYTYFLSPKCGFGFSIYMLMHNLLTYIRV